jgi:AbrB family looped-hinge helix DNA binding protein
VDTVTLSADFQIEIPADVREAMGLRPGQQFHIFRSGECIELVRAREMNEMRGFLRGIDTTIDRESDDE